MNLTWHTGCAGDELRLTVDWFNENNVRRETVVVLAIEDRDKPRALRVTINGVIVARTEGERA